MSAHHSAFSRFKIHARHGLAQASLFVVMMAPIAALTVCYPSIVARLIVAPGLPIGAREAEAVFVAVAMCLPWCGQCVSFPIYRELGIHMRAYRRRGLAAKFNAMIPGAAVLGLAWLAVVAGLFATVAGWPLPQLGIWAVLLSLHLVMSLALTYLIVCRDWPTWLACWILYIVCIRFAGSAWVVAPLAAAMPAALVIALDLRRHGRALTPKPRCGIVFGDAVNGLLVGGVLWADKLLGLLVGGHGFGSEAIFIALLPASVMLTYYHVRLAPTLERALERAVDAAGRATIRRYLQRLAECRRTRRRAMLELAAVGVGVALGLAGSQHLADVGIAAGPMVTFLGTYWALALCTIACHLLILVRAWCALRSFAGLQLVATAAVSIAFGGQASFALGIATCAIFGLVAVTWTLRQAWRDPVWIDFAAASKA